MSDVSPIFIGGLFKSGTTLLRAMLGQHSEIASGLETYWFDLDWKKPVDEELANRISHLRQFYEFSQTEINLFVESSQDEVEFVSQLLDAFTKREGKRRWAEKTPGNVLHMDRIRAGWPDARIVHIVRDPRDVFASLREARKWDSIEEFSSRWCQFLGTVDAYKRILMLNDDIYHELRYEHLVLDPQTTVRRLLDFLGAPWEPAVAQFSGRDDDFERVFAVTGKESTTLERLREPMTRARIGLWRHVLDENEIDAMRRAVAERGRGPLLDRIIAETSS